MLRISPYSRSYLARISGLRRALMGRAGPVGYAHIFLFKVSGGWLPPHAPACLGLPPTRGLAPKGSSPARALALFVGVLKREERAALRAQPTVY